MSGSGSLAGLRVLVVEDEALVAMLVEDYLTDMGCIVVDVAGTFEQGMAYVQADDLPIDGAVLDVNLGNAKVFPIADALSARGVRFVFASGYGAAGLADRYVGHAVLSKPFKREALEKLLLAAMA